MSYEIMPAMLAGAILSIFAAAPAAATTIKVEFSGTIYDQDEFSIDATTFELTPIDIYDPTTGPFAIGDTVNLTLTFVTGLTGTPTGGGALYEEAAIYVAQIGDFYVTNSLGDFTVANDRIAGASTLDTISFRSLIDGADVSHPVLAGLPVSNIIFSLRDNYHTAFNDTLLTPDKFDAALFNALNGSLTFEKFVDDNTVNVLSAYFSFDSVTVSEVSEVPLPAALPLFLAGIAGVGAAARRKRRNA